MHCMNVKSIAVSSYGNPHAIEIEVTFPPLPPAEAGTRLIDRGGMQG